MKNYIQDGEVLTLPAPYDVASGAGALVGAIFGVAQAAALSGAPAALVTRGVIDLATVTNAQMAIADVLYWDNTAKLVTKSTTGNTKIGVATSAKVTTGGTVNVRLNGVFG